MKYSLALTLSLLSVSSVGFTTSSTWVGGNANNDLVTSSNWSDNIVPNDEGIFQSAAAGNETPTLSIGGDLLTLNTFLFPSTEPNNGFSFTIDAPSGLGNTTYLTFNGSGVVVNNNNQQTFSVNNNGNLIFNNQSSAYSGSGTTPPIYHLTATGFSGPSGLVQFNDSSSAGSAIFNNDGGELDFHGNSTAANAIITSNAGLVQFFDSSNAGSSQITGTNGAEINFGETVGEIASASNANITADGAFIQFFDPSSMGSANLTAKNNSSIFYYSSTTGSTANVNLLTGSEFGLTSSATRVSIATLNGDSSSLVDLAGRELQVGANNQSSTFAGTMESTSAGGIFDKIGTGTFTFSGTGTYTGNTNVLSGNYVLNGSLNNTAVQVAAGANLSGSGQVKGGAGVTILGSIAPGNSIGTLSFLNTPFIQGAGSSYLAEISFSGASDFIDVTGIGSTATIGANTTLNVTTVDSLLLNRRYHLLHADDGIIGTYTNFVQSLSPFVIPQVLYDPPAAPTDLYVNFLTDFASFARPGTELCIAQLLDAVAADTPTDAQEVLLAALARLTSVGDLNDALEQLSGSQYTLLSQLAQYTDSRFSRRLFTSIRELVRPALVDCYDCSTSYQPWIRLEYNYANFNKSHAISKAQDNSWDISLGVHAVMNRNFIFGVAGNYSFDDVRFKHFKANNFQTGQGAVYGVYQNSRIYVFSNAIIGNTWANNFKRPIHFGTFKAEPRSRPSVFHGKYYAEIGIEWETCEFVVEPFIGGDAGWYNRERISEHGGGIVNRSIEKKQGAFGDTYFGAHFLTPYEDWNITGDLYWQHRFSSFEHHITTSFVDFGTSCDVEGNKRGRDGIVGTLNFSTCVCDDFEVYAEFNGQGWDHFFSVGLGLGLSYWW